MSNKKVLIGAVVILVAMGSAVFCYDPIHIKKTDFEFEYGQKVNLKAQDLFESIPNDYEIKMPVLKGKEYPEIGEYRGKVVYQSGVMKKESILVVHVQDRTKPEFSKFTDSISLSIGESEIILNEYFEVKDLSETKLNFNLEKVDFMNPGVYSAQVIAEDLYKNKNTKSFEIIIEESEKTQISEPIQEPNLEPTVNQPCYVNGILIVNKKHGLPSDYAPGENPEAVAKLNQLLLDMRSQGLSISDSYSGYRSYAYQDGLYWNYVKSYGQESADTFSARAGYSEHQSGLAFDLKQPNGALLESYPEVQWVAEHAHQYGFIVRYQSGKEHITGYMAEPWHLRYVGDVASDIYQSGLTLEEYLGVQGGTNY